MKLQDQAAKNDDETTRPAKGGSLKGGSKDTSSSKFKETSGSRDGKGTKNTNLKIMFFCFCSFSPTKTSARWSFCVMLVVLLVCNVLRNIQGG